MRETRLQKRLASSTFQAFLQKNDPVVFSRLPRVTSSKMRRFGLQDKPLEFRGYAFVAANSILVGLMSVYDKLMVTRLVKDQTPLGINLYRITASLPLVLMLSYMLETPTLPRDIVVSFLEPSFDSALASFD